MKKYLNKYFNNKEVEVNVERRKSGNEKQGVPALIRLRVT